ncbi:hypothetical protein [Acidihalobacter prosperus]
MSFILGRWQDTDMVMGKLFHSLGKNQLHKHLLEFDDHLLDDLGYQRRQLVDVTDTLFHDGSKWLHLFRPGASCCAIANRDISPPRKNDF